MTQVDTDPYVDLLRGFKQWAPGIACPITLISFLYAEQFTFKRPIAVFVALWQMADASSYLGRGKVWQLAVLQYHFGIFY
jgi:hypothetical protein